MHTQKRVMMDKSLKLQQICSVHEHDSYLNQCDHTE